MIVTAVQIITSAYERMNRLSPGETLSADDAAFGFRRLNELVDELSATEHFLFLAIQTASAQTGNITLGAGAWDAIAPGTEIEAVTVDDIPLNRVSVEQYAERYLPSTAGTPSVYAHDGLSIVYLWPTPTGQMLRLVTRGTVSEFIDQSTEYVVPPGWKSALSAGLAVRCAPVVIGGVPASLAAAERKCMGAVMTCEPAIIDVHSYASSDYSYSGRLV